MAHVFLPSIGRRYEWDCKADGSPPVAAPDGHMVSVGTPWLDIPMSAGHDGFLASPYWVSKALGGKGSGVSGTFSMSVYPGWAKDGTDLLSLECKSPDGKKWEIVVDVNGNVVDPGWGSGLGVWQLP